MILMLAETVTTVTPELGGILETAFTAVKTDVFGYMKVALPIGLGIMAAFMGVKLAIGFFRSVAR